MRGEQYPEKDMEAGCRYSIHENVSGDTAARRNLLRLSYFF